MMYEMEERIRYSEVNSSRRLKLSALADYFQDCCTFQSEDVGVGEVFLAEKSFAWILSYWEIVINSLPVSMDKVTVGTYPSSFKGFFGERSYYMKDETGNTLAFADSLWVFMNRDTLKPNRVIDEVYKAYEGRILPKTEYAWEGRKIPVEGEGENREVIVVPPYFIDTNFHMNNGKYIMVAESYLPEDFRVAKMRVEYRKSAMMGDCLYPVIYKKEGSFTVALTDEEKKPYAVIQFLA